MPLSRLYGYCSRVNPGPSLARNQYALGFGGNRGDVALNFSKALHWLEGNASCRIVASSNNYETIAVGRATGRFLNAAVVVETDLQPLALLHNCQQAERNAGRSKTARWDDRPLDIDMLLAGPGEIDDDAGPLRVPHPLMHVRRFVLDPLAEICPDLMHPVLRMSIQSMAEHWRQRPLCVSCPAEESRAILAEFKPSAVFVEDDADIHLMFAPADATAWPPGHRPERLAVAARSRDRRCAPTE